MNTKNNFHKDPITIVWNIEVPVVGSGEGWVGVASRSDGPGTASEDGWDVCTGGVTGLASWLGGMASSNPDQGEPRSWSPPSSGRRTRRNTGTRKLRTFDSPGNKERGEY